ncbi:hypothetical protein F4819DRAFT_177429 [Hypoxylon fuscum]|nr:hypothetical protein F4819DRAFT_177429 [Hypoxylon fuscum]
MRCSCLLLALVTSAAAYGIARPGQFVEKDLTLKSRESAEVSRSLEERLVPVDVGRVGTVMLKSRQNKRDDDEDWQRAQWDYLQNISDEEHNHDNDDDDDDGHHGPGDSGPNGGAIAGGVVGAIAFLFIILAIWYFVRIRPRRKQRQMEAAARQQDEIEKGYPASPSSSIHPPTTAFTRSPSEGPSTHVQFVRTPFPGRAPSVQTGSSISGLALPTPALTYSPSVTSAATAATPNLPPSQPHATSEKPPAYAAVIALQSSEPQPEASAYQMGQVPMPIEPPVYQLPLEPHVGATDMKGEPVARY